MISILLFRNGMVAAFDLHGKQISELQGPFWEAFTAIAKADLSELQEFSAGSVDCSIVREEWNRRAPGGEERGEDE